MCRPEGYVFLIGFGLNKGMVFTRLSQHWILRLQGTFFVIDTGKREEMFT